MVREILIKQNYNFNHIVFVFDNSQDAYADMTESIGERWKRMRDISSPTFSGSKMKIVWPLVHNSIPKLLDRFEERVRDNQGFDIYEDFGCLTADIIASTVLSYDSDVFNASDSIFMRKLKFFFDGLDPNRMKLTKKLLFPLFMAFPHTINLVRILSPRITSLETDWFLDLAKKMIIDRQSTGEDRPDYISLILNETIKVLGTVYPNIPSFSAKGRHEHGVGTCMTATLL